MTDANLRERAVLELLRDQYEGHQSVFIAYPSRELLPKFLGDYAPDAIVKTPTENLIIEVRTRTRSSDPKLSEIASRVANHPGWRFMVVRAEDLPSVELARSTLAQVQHVNSEFDEAYRRGLFVAALLVGWSLLEAVAGEFDTLSKTAVRPLSGLGLAEALEQHGLVGADEGRYLRQLAKTRSRLAHGDFSEAISGDRLTVLREVLTSMTRRLRDGAV